MPSVSMGIGGQFGSVRLDMTELEDLIKTSPGKVSKVVRATGIEVAGKASRKAPVGETGYLHNSIHSEMEAEFTADVYVDAEYGIYVEFGTYKMAAQPYLVPAVEETAAEFEAALAKVIAE